MIIYNISIKINAAIESDWVRWQQQEHMPDVMASGQFTDYKFCKLLEQEGEDECTYIVQYFAASLENYQHYIKHFGTPLRQKAIDKWGDQFIAFHSVMEVVS